jgi:hypothetical protein
MDALTKDAVINLLASTKQLLAVADHELAELQALRDYLAKEVADLKAQIGISGGK